MATGSGRRSAASTIGAALVLAGSPAAASEPGVAAEKSSVVLMRVRDYCDTRQAVLQDAGATVSAVFAALGVSIRWREGKPQADERCSRPACLDIEIHLYGQRSARLATGELTFGVAIISPEARGRTAFIFMDRIYAYAERFDLDAARMLGHVIAHEAGHLLLDSKQHAAEGLMRSHWNPDFIRLGAQRPLRFAANDGDAIRRRLGTLSARSGLP